MMERLDLKSDADFSRRKTEAACRRLALRSRRAILALVLAGLPISAQSPGTPVTHLAQQSQTSPHFPVQQPTANENSTLDEKRIRLLNRMRQKSMVDDAAKLLILARQLNAEASTMPDAERMHKAAEIEKLAKSVKEKMSYAVGGNPLTPSNTSVFP